MDRARLDHATEAHRYAEEVLAGEVLACKWVKAACRRFLDDLAREATDPAWSYTFDAAAGNRACAFVELLPHVKGRWAGQLIVLEAHQKFALCNVFGWRRKDDGTRRFRTVYEEEPRKNAKTTKLAGIGLYMLVADGEFGAEVYSAATTRDQARIVFDIAQQMARRDALFRARWSVEALTHSLLARDTASKFVPLSAEGHSLDGLNVSCALIDELHAHKTRTVHDVLDSGTGSRAQPLIWKITTAGHNRAGVCYDQRIYLTKILNAVLKRHGGLGYRVEGESTDDETFWGVIYTIDEGDDPLDEASWRKANPNYGISVDPDDLRRMAAVAKVQAAALNEFLTKRLNVWVNADSAWMNMLAWDACADRTIRLEDFAGERAVIALDAAFKKDLFAKVYVFQREGKTYVFGRYYMPQALCEARGWEQVGAWVREGWIRTTPGEVLDITAVREELVGAPVQEGTATPASGSETAPSQEDAGAPAAAASAGPAGHGGHGTSSGTGGASGPGPGLDPVRTAVLAAAGRGDLQRFELVEVAYDPAQLTQFATEMLEQGVPMVELRPTVLNFSPAMKELEELVAGRNLVHNGDPVLAWAVSNVVCHRDAKDNIYPRKERAEAKIDPAVALIMALGRALHAQPQAKSFWETAA